MEKKVQNQSKEFDVEDHIQFCHQSVVMEMKRSPSKKFSVLFLVVVVLSFGSTVTRLRTYMLPSVPRRTNSDLETSQLFQQHARDETFWCDRTDNRTDICFMRGDVHLVPGNSTSLTLYSRRNMASHRDEIIWPYPRKWDDLTLKTVKPVVLRSTYVDEIRQPFSVDRAALCDAVHLHPLLVFSAGGFAGNPYHDFNDVLIPLFINSRNYGGEVVFGITDGREWWLHKFSALFKLLSNHKIINLNTANQIHCFPMATIGLRVHAALAIYPSFMANNETMKDFQHLLHQAFGEQDADYFSTYNTSKNCTLVNVNRDVNKRQLSGYRRCLPKLIIFGRKHTRVILNQDQVVKMARKEGFEVEVLEPSGQTDMRTIYKALHTADVMLGVHGAALTHMLFMRPRSVFIQIVPLGTDWPAYNSYHEPALNMLDLQYLEYRISPEESTLIHTYSVNHLAVTNPEAIIAKNWEVRKKMYLEGQDVRLSLPQLKLTLRKARRLALQAFAGLR